MVLEFSHGLLRSARNDQVIIYKGHIDNWLYSTDA